MTHSDDDAAPEPGASLGTRRAERRAGVDDERLRRIVNLHEDERRRVSHELYDDIGQ